MSLEDSFKKHGVVAIRVDMAVVMGAAQAAIDTLRRGNQRTVTSLAVAATLVQMHSDIAGVTTDETLELIRMWLAAGLVPSVPPR